MLHESLTNVPTVTRSIAWWGALVLLLGFLAVCRSALDARVSCRGFAAEDMAAVDASKASLDVVSCVVLVQFLRVWVDGCSRKSGALSGSSCAGMLAMLGL
mmetsp:Transcript_53041/g.141063  ORF Transcript_53041/g.141063 Transcript_53041/m.141063 type:complete len:101 (-) Transcript_53041:83-385(-)